MCLLGRKMQIAVKNETGKICIAFILMNLRRTRRKGAKPGRGKVAKEDTEIYIYLDTKRNRYNFKTNHWYSMGVPRSQKDEKASGKGTKTGRWKQLRRRKVSIYIFVCRLLFGK